MLSSCLFVVHDTGGSGENDETEGSGGEEHVDPGLDLGDLDVESGGDDTTLVDSTVELDDDFARSVVVNDLESVNVTVLLHDRQESDDDLGRRSDEDLSLSSLFSVADVVETIGL